MQATATDVTKRKIILFGYSRKETAQQFIGVGTTFTDVIARVTTGECIYIDLHKELITANGCPFVLKLGIIANQKLGTKERLDSWGLRQYFDVIAASAEIGYAKPDKEIFEKAFELAKCTAAESMMVGDRLDNDIIPAKSLGMKTVWIKNGLAQYQNIELGEGVADYQIHSLSEILQIL